MELLDFNLHLPPTGDFDQELSFALFDAEAALRGVGERLRRLGGSSGNVMLLDADLLRRPDELKGLMRIVDEAGLRATTMIDPRERDALELVDEAARQGVSGIKFHAYFQNLADYDFPLAVACAQRAATRGLWIAVCCSYGTQRVHAVSGVRLLTTLARAVPGARLIALHGGGKLVLDVMSVAFDFENILLETSFSLPFWVGSSVETDFVFAMKKLGAHRWVYGSDHPHCEMSESLVAMQEFFDRHRFSDEARRAILHDTARTQLWG